MQYVNFIGLDLGQASDPSAIVLLESPVWVDEDASMELRRRGIAAHGWTSPDRLFPEMLRAVRPAPEPPTLLLRGLKRYPLGTRYPAIVDDVGTLLGTQWHAAQTALVIDKTGVGAPVFDMFLSAGMQPIGINITGGDSVHQDGDLFRVPKRDLVGAVSSLLQYQRVKFAEQLPELPILTGELKNFRVKIDPTTAHDSYSAWHEHEHDDLVLAFAIAAWYAAWCAANVATGFSFSYTQLSATARRRA